VPVERRALAEHLSLRGTVAPVAEHDALVSPQTPGRLLKVLVVEGDTVTAGQLLATIDDGPSSDASRQAEAALQRAQAEQVNAETTLQRVQKVFERGIAARQELDDATAKLAAAKANAAEAEAAAHQAGRQLGRAQLRSPLAGTVLKVFRKPGELVDGTPAMAVLEVADLTTLELLADAAPAELVRLKVGQLASVRFGFISAPLQGHVARVSPSIDRQTGLGTARVQFTRPDEGSPPVGTLGLAQVDVGAAREVHLVPSVALRAGGAEVVLCEHDQARVLQVRAGEVTGEATVVETELPDGAQVALEPVGLSDGAALAVQR
jgi:HlyD family secretion protein